MNHTDAKIIQADLKAQFLKEHQREGEVYAGLVLGIDGEPDYHLFILPGALEKANWKDAMKWARGLAGDLPTRREGRILFANAKAAFKADWHWLNEQREVNTACAWVQDFVNGNQNYTRKSDRNRARAVRRLILQ